MNNDQPIFGQKWIDIVFENRNTAYGAYELRKNYERNIGIGMMTVLASFIIVLTSFKLHAILFPKAIKSPIEIIHTFENIRIDKILLPKPDEIIKPKGSNMPDNSRREMLVSRDVDDEDTTQPDQNAPVLALNDQPNNSGGPVGYSDGNAGITEPISEPAPPAAKPQVVDFAEVMPKFPGDDDALFEFIKNHLKYPEIERDYGISGQAVVSFVVNTSGEVVDVKIIKSDSKGFSKASEEVVRKLPNFIPARQGGKAVNVRMAIPIKFKSL